MKVIKMQRLRWYSHIRKMREEESSKESDRVETKREEEDED